VGERKAQIDSRSERSCLDGTFDDRLQEILVEGGVAGGNGSYAVGVGVDSPNAVACLSKATRRHTANAAQANDGDAVLRNFF
jgi:hypothetical protein